MTRLFFICAPWGVVLAAVALCVGSVLATDWVNAVLFGVCSVVAVCLACYENRQSQLENTQGTRGRGPER
ncbi:hypothetical protein EJ571_10800 [Mycobacteroides franklinii]|uniref:Uncharacterized protein n=1 Tax=Mycobacteroides franklinii TaxID=948102 RepID=A0A4R5PC80_9MYCO|nr:hypothetical protein EJ571_10800 [Mycobacteroides franklinii]TDZ44030.1 hypothetical protein CCUG64054_04095 [Mycobacteroides franklinii]TDZ51164.1 hypothetical protein CCUG63697_02680 [Mycobacteroides franklinii]TDZ57584.1 hypothetical protein CCUG63696_04091 [Mycobacteroides franklinii]TDZ64526.1 hypothetical protein CCUG63695_04022 [Mycobacteroides franklinii]